MNHVSRTASFALERKRRLSVIHTCGCTLCIALYLVVLCIVSHTSHATGGHHRNALNYIIVSAIAGGAFATMTLVELVGLVASLVDTDDRHFVAATLKRSTNRSSKTTPAPPHQSAWEWWLDNVNSPKLIVFTTNLVATISHLTVALGNAPVVKSFAGRSLYVSRAAEWAVLVPIMMLLLHSYDRTPSHQGDAAPHATVVMSSHDWFSLVSQTASTLVNMLPSLYRLPPWLSWSLLAFSMLLYLNIFVLICRVWNNTSELKVCPSHSVQSDADGDVFLATSLQNLGGFRAWVAMNEYRQLSSRTLLLSGIFAMHWLLNLLVRFGGIARLYSQFVEHSLLTCTDVASKNAYTFALGEAHIRSQARQIALSTLLSIERTNATHRRRFLRYVMHECIQCLCTQVRVPLNAVKLGLAYVTDTLSRHDLEWEDSVGAEETDVEDVLRIMDSSIDVMSETLNDVLSFAAIEEGRLRLNCECFNVTHMLEKTIAAHRSSAKDKDVALELVVDSALSQLRLYADHRRLGGCVSNFISNAIKFSKDGIDATVNVVATLKTMNVVNKSRVLWPGDSQGRACVEVLIEVRDNGCGISDADQKRLFTPFSQIRPGELQQGRGSGLGLAISRDIVEKHGGSIGVTSKLGDGSTFYICIPLAVVVDMPQPSKARQAVVSSPDAAPNNPLLQRALPALPVIDRQLTALVVDDVLSNRKLFCMQIKKLGFDVHEAQDGRLALIACSVDPSTLTLSRDVRQRFDVVFMDSVMPVMSGVEATAILRSVGLTMPIIGVTGNALEEDVRAFLNAGASCVLSKPVFKHRLEQQLQSLGLLPNFTRLTG